MRLLPSFRGQNIKLLLFEHHPLPYVRSFRMASFLPSTYCIYLTLILRHKPYKRCPPNFLLLWTKRKGTPHVIPLLLNFLGCSSM